MRKYNLKSLKFLNFLKLQPERQQRIAEAPDSFVRHASEYRPNQLAELLHPGVQHLRVSEIIDEAPGVKSYYLVPEETADGECPALPAYFAAGQYLSIQLQIDGSNITRPYSISSSPREALDGRYMITVRKNADGFASGYIHETWETGTGVTASMPLGSFTYTSLRDAGTVVAIAGGSGITPFRSMARAIADGDEDFNLILLYGTGTLKDALFEEELLSLAESCDRFTLINVLSNAENETAEEQYSFRPVIEYGFITADIIRKYAPNDSKYSVFLCGPQAMYRFADKEIAKLNIPGKYVRRELFGEYGALKQGTDGTRTFNLTVRQGENERSVTCSSTETLLISMEKAGLKAPSRCRSGECGWCRSRLISGDIHIPEGTDRRRMADKQSGYIHPCITFPCSDIVIEIPEFMA